MVCIGADWWSGTFRCSFSDHAGCVHATSTPCLLLATFPVCAFVITVRGGISGENEGRFDLPIACRGVIFICTNLSLRVDVTARPTIDPLF